MIEKRKSSPKPHSPKSGGYKPTRAVTPVATPAKKVNKPAVSYFENKILAVLKKDTQRDFPSRELMRQSGIKEKATFYAGLKSLQEGGQILVDKNHRVRLFVDRSEVTATLVSLSRGFGFARPEDSSGDIFIHGSSLNGALVGDTILVGNVRTEERGASGKIRRIIESAKDTTTGTVRITSFGAELIPDNNIRYNPTLEGLQDAKDGDKVLARLGQDNNGDWTRASVLKVFGSGESAKVCSDAIIEQYSIPTVFPQQVLEEAERAAATVITPEDIARRTDLRGETIFTIDGADAKDLDDAISLSKTADGWELGVHIADVSHYVHGRSALDEEALLRGTSVYFADRVIPMLPQALSNGVCSLTAGQDKLCFSALITLSNEGRITKYQFVKSVIRSAVRGVYSEVNEIFAGTASADLLEKYAPVQQALTQAKVLADLLERNSALRGTMEIDSGESRFVLDENGICVDVKPRESGAAQGLIEQLMICANTCAAKFSMDMQLPFLYRVHESPEPQRVQELMELLKALGISCKELLKEKINTADFAAILDRVKGTPAQVLVSQRLLRTMEKARYATEALGHFGLVLKDYSHFTSPIRRYPDTAIHRIMSALLDGMPKEDIARRFASFAEKAATESSVCEVRATRAERDAEDCYMAEFLRQHLGEEFPGTISGVTKNGVFVRLASSVEGFVPVDSFANNHFSFDGIISQRCARTERVLTVGTPLQIRVVSAHVATGKVDFAPVE